MGGALEGHELVGYTGVLRRDVTVLCLSPTWNEKTQDNGYPSLKEEEEEQREEQNKEAVGREEMGHLLAASAAKGSEQAPSTTIGIVLPLAGTSDFYLTIGKSLYHSSPKTLWSIQVVPVTSNSAMHSSTVSLRPRAVPSQTSMCKPHSLLICPNFISL